MEKERLIERLRGNGYLHSEKVIKAMQAIPREQFIPEGQRQRAYADTPLPIGHEQTISAPHMVAIMTEALQLERGHAVLEVGTGAGYHAAVVAHIVTEGHVYSVERVPDLAAKARHNFQRLGIDNVTVTVGDGSRGLPEHAPYDRIYATCAAPHVPEALTRQLTRGGRLLLPLGQRTCRLTLIEKNGEVRRTDLGGCAFVPMVSDGGSHGH
ncbi:MAG: protein-L-isoaspartate(D-aspartate) O-methyltransferase [Candidatus Thermoplasmatota archaeon]|nr:protein-L-isoaspartate(D-aspartate) O-methyltransferase [Candidatus Thermoplasmatota archaeon]